MAEELQSGTREAGGALLEVVVALAVLVIALMPLSAILANATRLSGRAARMRHALHGASAVAESFAPAADYAVGWRRIGSPGPDGLPGTGDDVSVPRVDGAPCWRRVSRDTPQAGWTLIEATCGHAAAGPDTDDPDAVVVTLMVRR